MQVLPQLSTARRAKAEDLHRKLAANEYSGSQPPSANASPVGKRKDQKIKVCLSSYLNYSKLLIFDNY